MVYKEVSVVTAGYDIPGRAALIFCRMLARWPVVSIKHSSSVPVFANTTLCTYDTSHMSFLS